MIKKLIGLVAIAGAAGLSAVAGCTVETITTTDASTDSGPGTTDASKKDAEVAAECPGEAPKAADVKAALEKETGAYKTTKKQAVCSEEILKQLDTDLRAKKYTKYSEIQAALTAANAACGACAFTDSTAAQWGALINVSGGSIVNNGGCFEANGASAKCADAINQVDLCQGAACSKCEDAQASGPEFAACRQGQESLDACAESIGLADACTEAELTAGSKACEVANQIIIVNIIRGVCGGTATDGGTDAKAD